MKTASMRCESRPSEVGQPNPMDSNWRLSVLPYYKARPSTDLRLRCGRSSAWGLLSNACTACVSARRRSGAFWAPWASVRKNQRSGPLNATRTQCAHGSVALALVLKIILAGRPTDRLCRESGISERPTRVRTWAPRVRQPSSSFTSNWNEVSVIAGLTRANCLFRLHDGSINKEEIVDFLEALKTDFNQPLLVIWDGLKAHSSRLVRDYLDGLNGHILVAFLPPYAPDMTPVEYLWALLKRHAKNSRAPKSDPRSSPLAGNKLSCGVVMNYGTFKRRHS
jgi:transposase